MVAASAQVHFVLVPGSDTLSAAAAMGEPGCVSAGSQALVCLEPPHHCHAPLVPVVGQSGRVVYSGTDHAWLILAWRACPAVYPADSDGAGCSRAGSSRETGVAVRREPG